MTERLRLTSPSYLSSATSSPLFFIYKMMHILHVNPSGNSSTAFPLTGVAHKDLTILWIHSSLNTITLPEAYYMHVIRMLSSSVVSDSVHTQGLYSPPGSLSVKFSRWDTGLVAVSYSRGPSRPSDWTWALFLLHWQADSLLMPQLYAWWQELINCHALSPKIFYSYFSPYGTGSWWMKTMFYASLNSSK